MKAGDVKHWPPVSAEPAPGRERSAFELEDFKALVGLGAASCSEPAEPAGAASKTKAKHDPVLVAFSVLSLVLAVVALAIATIGFYIPANKRQYTYQQQVTTGAVACVAPAVSVPYEHTVVPTSSVFAGTQTLIHHDEKTSKRYVIEQKLDGTPIETTSVTDWRPAVGF